MILKDRNKINHTQTGNNPMNRHVLKLMLVMAILAIAGCSEDNPTMPDDQDPSAPTASYSVSPSSGDVVDIFQFDASASTDDMDMSAALQVRWDWQGDGVYETTYSFEKTASHQFVEAGTYSVGLQIKDSNDLTGTTSRSVTVTQNITSISIAPSVTDVGNGFTRQFVAAASDGNGNSVNTPFSWSSSSAGLGSINNQGFFTAGVTVPLSGSVMATAGGVGGTSDVNITAVTVSYSNDLLVAFQGVCGVCHGSSGGLNLTSYSSLMAGNSNNGPVVIPGNPDGSIIIQKLSSNPPFGDQMPKAGSVTQSWLNKLWIWIKQGAINN